jgi:chromosome segregation ATPase
MEDSVKFNRNKQVTSAAADDTTPETDAPEVPAVPDGLAAEIERLRTEAQQIREQAAQDRTGAQERVTTAREQAAALIKAEETAAHSAAQEAAAAERRAGKLDETVGFVAEAVARQAAAEEAADLASTLVAEQEDLGARIEGLDVRLTRLGEEQQEVTSQLEASRQAGDVDAITSLRARLAAIGDAHTALSGQRETAQQRLDAIDDGQDRGELHDALRAGKRHTATARNLLNLAYPDRAEAVADRAATELLATIEGNMERIAEENKPKPPTAQRVVHL